MGEGLGLIEAPAPILDNKRVSGRCFVLPPVTEDNTTDVIFLLEQEEAPWQLVDHATCPQDCHPIERSPRNQDERTQDIDRDAVL